MALRHYQGSVPGSSATAEWTCPTCGTKNQRPIEQGCAVCKAGADGVKGAPPRPRNATADEPAPVTSPTVIPSADRMDLEEAFAGWRMSAAGAHVTAEELPLAAFIAGAIWARQTAPLVRDDMTLHLPAPVKATVDPTRVQPFWIEDDQQRATVIAALRFYAENVLAYSPVEGQLTKEQTEALADTLTPPDDTTEELF